MGGIPYHWLLYDVGGAVRIPPIYWNYGTSNHLILLSPYDIDVAERPGKYYSSHATMLSLTTITSLVQRQAWVPYFEDGMFLFFRAFSELA